MFSWLKNPRPEWILKGKICCLSYVFDELDEASICAEYCQLQIGAGHGDQSVALSKFCLSLESIVAANVLGIIWQQRYQERAERLSNTLIKAYPFKEIINRVEIELQQLEMNLRLNVAADNSQLIQRQLNWYFDSANQQFYRVQG